MPRTPFLSVAALSFVALAPFGHAQQTAPAPAAVPPSILAQLTPDETKAAGLSKLSASERAALDAALNRYLGIEVQKSSEQAAAKAVAKAVATRAVVIESRVAGTFRGLSGRTRIPLENGQLWQQSNTGDKFDANIENPDVIIVSGVFGYAMRVGGINGKFYVKQVGTH